MRIYIYTDNHRNSPGIGDTVRFLQCALQDCGHEAFVTHRIALGHPHIVIEGFTEADDVAPLVEAKAAGTRFILIGTEPIVGGSFNGGVETKHWHYGNTEYWAKRYDYFHIAATLADAVWVLAESMVDSYRAVLPRLPVAFLPHGHVEGFEVYRHRAEERKDIDLYFSGSLTDSRRALLQQLGRKHCVVHNDQSTGEYMRQDYMSRSKICLSLRLSQGNVIPSVSRLHFHLQHQNFVLHEAYPLPCALDPYVLHVPREEFADWVDEALRSDRRREIAEAAHARFRTELSMKRLLPPLLRAALGVQGAGVLTA